MVPLIDVMLVLLVIFMVTAPLLTTVVKLDLPKATVDQYFAHAPDVIGFINGYAAAHTFDVRNGQAFMSYDYYLDQNRLEADVVADLDELMRLNPKRPYYLLIHVRETNSIKRVMSILAQLAERPEVVPLDTFLKLAASNPTFKVRYKDERPEGEQWIHAVP